MAPGHLQSPRAPRQNCRFIVPTQATGEHRTDDDYHAEMPPVGFLYSVCLTASDRFGPWSRENGRAVKQKTGRRILNTLGACSHAQERPMPHCSTPPSPAAGRCMTIGSSSTLVAITRRHWHERGVDSVRQHRCYPVRTASIPRISCTTKSARSRNRARSGPSSERGRVSITHRLPMQAPSLRMSGQPA